MGDRTGISWTDATWNPIRGCSRVSQGCVHCYAETVAARFSKPGQAYHGLTDKNGRWNGKIMVVEKHMEDPLRWRSPRRIFVNSMSDLFHENIADDVIDRVFAVMAMAPQHTFQVLTKRPERMLAYMSKGVANRVELAVTRSFDGWSPDSIDRARAMPLPNVWLGVSTEDQATADERIPFLRRTPAAVRFISAEPLLGPIELVRGDGEYLDYLRGRDTQGTGEDAYTVHTERLDWVIVGGESGPGHRSMDPAWAEGIAAQCLDAGVAVFVKQDSGPRAGEQRRLSDELWALKQFPTAAPAVA